MAMKGETAGATNPLMKEPRGIDPPKATAQIPMILPRIRSSTLVCTRVLAVDMKVTAPIPARRSADSPECCAARAQNRAEHRHQIHGRDQHPYAAENHGAPIASGSPACHKQRAGGGP